MKTLKIAILSLTILFATFGANAQNSAFVKPTIIFVHGIWADGSSWNNQITALQEKGYDVVSVQNPLTSLADDVAVNHSHSETN